MLVRIQAFGATHKDKFPDGSIGGKAFAAVDAAVAQLSHHALDKMATRREEIRLKAAARRKLAEQLEKIARTARVIAQDKPGFDDPFRVTRLRSDQALVTAGRMFAREAERVKPVFVAHNLRESVLTELPGLVETLDQAIRSRDTGRIDQTAAQAGIDAAIASGLAAARKLDIIVPNAFEDDPIILRVWDTQRHLGRTRRPRTAATAPLPTVPDQPESLPAPLPANSGSAAVEPAKAAAATVDLKVVS
jgi:hypothetical protein